MEQLPFHESIVEAISKAGIVGLECLGKLILITKIPKNHAKIIEAYRKRIEELHSADKGGTVIESLLQQQQVADQRVVDDETHHLRSVDLRA